MATALNITKILLLIFKKYILLYHCLYVSVLFFASATIAKSKSLYLKMKI